MASKIQLGRHGLQKCGPTIRNYESGGSHSAVYRNGESVSSSDSSSDTVEKADRPRSYLGGLAEGATDVPDWSNVASGRPTKPYDAYFKGASRP